MRRTAPSFVARARRLRPAYDLLAGYERSGAFFERAGLGVAAGRPAFRFRMALSGVQAPGPLPTPQMLLSIVDTSEADRGAPPPLLFASIPFDSRRSGRFALPARAIRRDREGETWAIEIVPRSGSSPNGGERRVSRAVTPSEPFSGMQMRPNPTTEVYARAVAEALRHIRDGELRKVVLARTVEVAAGRGLDPARLLSHLRAVEPDCYSFAMDVGVAGHEQRERVLVGASPELLVSRRGREVRANPLAGSAPRSGDPEEDRTNAERLLASAKDREEHVIVADAVEETLTGFCDELERAPEPVLRATANVWHLSTPFCGTLREPPADALTLAAALHPTPAVCGTPRDAALRLISALEPFQRGGYGGPIGWVDASGDGVWAIALRCAELRGDVARLFAGAGIVAASDPEAELEETERKFRAFLDSLRWG